MFNFWIFFLGCKEISFEVSEFIKDVYKLEYSILRYLFNVFFLSVWRSISILVFILGDGCFLI